MPARNRDVVSFLRSLRATTLSPRTIQSCSEACNQFFAFLVNGKMPTDLRKIKREHVEVFISYLLKRWRPTTAANRYRGLQAFFKWAVEEGGIKESPMARMKPPEVGEVPVPVLSSLRVTHGHPADTPLITSPCDTKRVAAPLHFLVAVAGVFRGGGYPPCDMGATPRAVLARS